MHIVDVVYIMRFHIFAFFYQGSCTMWPCPPMPCLPRFVQGHAPSCHFLRRSCCSSSASSSFLWPWRTIFCSSCEKQNPCLHGVCNSCMANGVTHMMQSWRVTSTLGSPYKQCHISTGGYPCVAPETVLVCFHDLWPTQENWLGNMQPLDPLAKYNAEFRGCSTNGTSSHHGDLRLWGTPNYPQNMSKWSLIVQPTKNHVNAAKALQFARRVQKPWLTIHFGHNGWMLLASIFGVHANTLEIICRKTMKWSKIVGFWSNKTMYPTSD